jgi:hypothetical protein
VVVGAAPHPLEVLLDLHGGRAASGQDDLLLHELVGVVVEFSDEGGEGELGEEVLVGRLQGHFNESIY